MSDSRLRDLERRSAADPEDEHLREAFFRYARRLGYATPCEGLGHNETPELITAWRQAIYSTCKCTRCEFLARFVQLHPPLSLEGKNVEDLVPWRWAHREKVRDGYGGFRFMTFPAGWSWPSVKLAVDRDIEQHTRLAEFGDYNMGDR